MAKNILDVNGNPVKRNDGELFYSDTIPSKDRLINKGVNKELRQLTIVGTDETQDRDGDILTMSGWDIENYLANPVFLWAHDYASVPLAAAVKVIKKKAPKPHMVFVNQFAPEGIFPFADMIYELYNLKQINASSVGFIPKEWENLDTKEPSGFWNPRKFIKQELLELSGCAVPCNPAALQLAVKGFGKAFKGFDPAMFVKHIMGEERMELEANDNLINEIGSIGSKVEFIDETEAKVHQVPEAIKGLTEIEKLCGEGAFEITKELGIKPYPNEHACRINEPDKYEKFARKNCYVQVDDKCVDVIFGIKEGKSEIQAYRYDKKTWTKSSAASHCKTHKGTFDAAAEEASQDDVVISEFAGEENGKLKFLSECGLKVFIDKNMLYDGNIVNLTLNLSSEVKAEFAKVMEEMKSLRDAVSVRSNNDSQVQGNKLPSEPTSEKLFDEILAPVPKSATSISPKKVAKPTDEAKLKAVAHEIQKLTDTIKTHFGK